MSKIVEGKGKQGRRCDGGLRYESPGKRGRRTTAKDRRSGSLLIETVGEKRQRWR